MIIMDRMVWRAMNFQTPKGKRHVEDCNSKWSYFKDSDYQSSLFTNLSKKNFNFKKSYPMSIFVDEGASVGESVLNKLT